MTVAMNAAEVEPPGRMSEAESSRALAEIRKLEPPGKMAKPHMVLLNSFTAKVEWTPPADLHSTPTRSAKMFAEAATSCSASILYHAPVLGYRLRYQILKTLEEYGEVQDEPFVLLDETWDAESQRAILKKLTAGADYIFEVAAFNSGGQGMWSDQCDPFHMPDLGRGDMDASMDDVLTELQRPALSSTMPNSIEINWSRPCDRGSTVATYEVLCSTDPEFNPGSKTTELRIEGSSERISFEDLVPNTVYYFKYRAVNAVGPSRWSPHTPGIATAATLPYRAEAPARVGNAPWQSYEVCISWLPPASCGIPIQHYSVRVSQSPDMRNAVEISIGGDQKSVASSGQKLRPIGSAIASSPSSPSARRPGFNKDHYALTQMKVKGLWPSLTYYFQVKAANQIGESPWSDVSRAMETAAAPPGRCGKPLFMSGTRLDGIVVSWAAPDFLGHTDGILGYNFQGAQNAMFVDAQNLNDITEYKKVDSVGALGEDMLVTTVPCLYGIGSDHFFRVRAFGPAGNGEWSVTSESMHVAPEVPLRPEPPCEFQPMQKAVHVRWRSTSGQGSKVTGYRLRYDTRSDMIYPTELPIVKGDDLEATVPGLQQGCKYYFQVCAINAVGKSAWSASAEPVMLRCMPPAKMARPHLVSRNATSLTIGFTPPLGARQGECQYVVRYSNAADRMSLLEDADSDVQVIQEADPLGVTVNGLKPGTSCAFQVYAVNEAGRGDDNSDIEDFITAAAAPGTPQVPELIELTSWSLCLNIKLGEENGSPVTQYNLAGEDIDNGTQWETGLWDAVVEGAGRVDVYSVNRLTPGTGYRFRLMAVSKMGQSSWSAWSEEMRTHPHEPFPVPGLTAFNVGARDLWIRWSCPHNNGAPITEYKVQWSINKDFTGRATTTHITAELEAHCDKCTPGTFVYARVAAANSEGYGRDSEVLQTLLDTDVPCQPGKPKVIDVGPIHASVGWLYPFDCGRKIFASWLTYTETETDGRDHSERHKGEMLLDAPGRSVRIDNMFSSREYIFMVVVENEHGLSVMSEPSIPQRIAPAQAPTAPSAPVFRRSTISDIVVRWISTEPMGSPILDQLVAASIYPDFPEDKTVQTWVAAWKPPAASEPCEVESDSCQTPGAPAAAAAAAEAATAAAGPHAPKSPKGPLTGRPQGSRPTPKTFTISEEGQEKRLTAVRGLPVESSHGFGGVTKRIKSSHDIWGEYTISGLDPGTYYYFKALARNGVGLGEWSGVGKKGGTKPSIPDAIPETPGIELLRTGCTTLTFGWQRPNKCNGAPVTHYIVRYSDDRAKLWTDEAKEFTHEETKFSTWPGMVIEPPTLPPIEKPDLADKETVMVFVEYIMVRFGGLEASWEWLDVNGNGNVSSEEFLEGDIENGPPFADFPRQDVLDRVWKLLDSDGGGSISMNEFNKLRPYMNEISKGGHGIEYDGVYCLLPNLLPAQWYYIMVRSASAGGLSEWVECAASPHRTLCMTPMPMEPLEGVREKRTPSSITFRWKLPWDSGEPLNLLRLRWFTQEVDDAGVDRGKLHDGSEIEFTPDPQTGMLPTEFVVERLLPGQIVLGSARAYNLSGGARQWSNLCGPGAGMPEQFWDWDTCSLSVPPETPTSPRILEHMLVSKDALSNGAFTFSFGRLHGRRLTRVHFQMFDANSEIVNDFNLEASQVENASEARDNSELGFPFKDLLPGEQYNIRVCIHTGAGASEWSAKCPLVRMPPDRPEECAPILSELASPVYIEIKWQPPHPNGAPILKYEVKMLQKMASAEDAPEDDWRLISPKALAEFTFNYGFDGRRVTERDSGGKLYRTDRDGTTLEPNIRYWFKVRACNSVNWGAWSSPSGFLTKPVKPGRTPDIQFVSSSIREVCIKWEEPECYGKAVAKYDLFAAPNVVYMRWVQLSCALLDTTVGFSDAGADHNAPLGNAILNEETGKEDFDQLICDHAMYIPLTSERKSYTLAGLLPGSSYFFVVRSVNDIGKGQFSNVTPGFSTLPDKLGAIEPMVLQSVTEAEANVSFRLPFNQGCKIEEVAVTMTRCSGPLSLEEVDADTGECHRHLAGQEHLFRPEELESTVPKLLVQKVAGLTHALRQNHRDEGIAGPTEHQPTFTACTGKTYSLCLNKLRPGTTYEASWSCRAGSSWSSQAERLTFTTKADIPDDPVAMVVFGL